MAYRNYMEDAVIDVLKHVMKKNRDICACERCKEDMVAWVLNRLPSKYVVTRLGGAYTEFENMKTQSKTDVIVRLMEAIKVVGEHPRH